MPQTVNPPRLQMLGLVKRYHHQPVLNGVSLTLEDGSLCLLVGANGAGKTTLLRILAGLVRPDGGEILLQAGETAPGVRRLIGYLGHQTLFYLDLSAHENLTHYARLYGLDCVKDRVDAALASVGLNAHQDKPVRAFSRGMGQRLALARALLHDPCILLLDEPYTGLDQEAAHFLDERLRGLRQPGRVILLAAHRPQRLLPIASHIAWLQDGVIRFHLPVERLADAPELGAYLQEVA